MSETRKTDEEIRERLKLLDDMIADEKTNPKPHSGVIIYYEGQHGGLRWVLGNRGIITQKKEDCSVIVNHEEAFELAKYTQKNSNLARAYLDIKAKHDELNIKIKDLNGKSDEVGEFLRALIQA